MDIASLPSIATPGSGFTTLATTCLLGLTAGLAHAVGPDHCAAMLTLTGAGGEGRRRRALGTAVRFALGHALLLAVIAAVCLLAGVGLSETFTHRAEIFGGAVLVAVAVAALVLPSTMRHGHPHLPGHETGHRHARVSGAAGALMAVSGVRGLLLALPPLLVGGGYSLAAWTYLPSFALGILIGMGAVGMLLAEGLGALTGRLGLWVERAAHLAAAAVGVVWIVVRL